MLAGLLDRGEETTDQPPIEAAFDPTLMDFLDAQAMTVPAFRRIRRLLEERGWTGWTHFTRTDATGPASA